MSSENIDPESMDTQAHQPTFDPNPLAALHERAKRTDPGFVGELIDVFLSDMTTELVVLERAIAVGDTAACAFSAHRLLSSCGTFGAYRLASLLKDAEFLAKTGELAVLPGQFGAITAEYEQLVIALKQAGY